MGWQELTNTCPNDDSAEKQNDISWMNRMQHAVIKLWNKKSGCEGKIGVISYVDTERFLPAAPADFHYRTHVHVDYTSHNCEIWRYVDIVEGDGELHSMLHTGNVNAADGTVEIFYHHEHATDCVFQQYLREDDIPEVGDIMLFKEDVDWDNTPNTSCD